jgi:hypothetical protein
MLYRTLLDLSSVSVDEIENGLSRFETVTTPIHVKGAMWVYGLMPIESINKTTVIALGVLIVAHIVKGLFDHGPSDWNTLHQKKQNVFVHIMMLFYFQDDVNKKSKCLLPNVSKNGGDRIIPQLFIRTAASELYDANICPIMVQGIGNCFDLFFC